MKKNARRITFVNEISQQNWFSPTGSLIMARSRSVATFVSIFESHLTGQGGDDQSCTIDLLNRSLETNVRRHGV